MSDVKIFFIPNWLDVEGHRRPVIVSGRKPACWHCSKIGHLSAVCPKKKAPKKPDQNPSTLLPVLANGEKEATIVSPTVRAVESETAEKQPPTSPLFSMATTEDSRAEWLTVGKGGRKIKPASPHSRKLSQVDTHSSPPSQSQSKTVPLQLMHKQQNLPNPNTRPKLLLNSPFLLRSGCSVKAGRSSSSSWISKSGWTSCRNLHLNQDPLDPTLHLPSNPEPSDHLPFHLRDLCLLLR